MLKKCFLIWLLLCLWVLGATAADVRPGSERVLVDSCGVMAGAALGTMLIGVLRRTGPEAKTQE